MKSSGHEKIRVLHLVLALNIGGLERFVLDLLRGRNAEVFDVEVLCLEQPGVLAPQLAAFGVGVRSLGWKQLSKRTKYLTLLKAIRQARPDVLHSHNPIPHFYGAVASRILRVPGVVHTKHGRNDPTRRKVTSMSRIAGVLSDWVVAVSADAAALAIGVDKTSRHKVKVIRNGVDIVRFPFGPRRVVSTPSPRLVCVARLDPVKDHGTLLAAMRMVADRYPDVALDVVGDGPSRRQLEQLTETLALQRNVSFCGFADDVAAFVSGADLFVLSSLSEGVSLTLLEAMASGVPVVATDVGGNREVVEDGVTGVLVPPRSPQALAEAIIGVLCQPGRGLEMGRKARSRVEAHFNMAEVVRCYEELYLSTLRNHGLRVA